MTDPHYLLGLLAVTLAFSGVGDEDDVELEDLTAEKEQCGCSKLTLFKRGAKMVYLEVFIGTSDNTTDSHLLVSKQKHFKAFFLSSLSTEHHDMVL